MNLSTRILFSLTVLILHGACVYSQKHGFTIGVGYSLNGFHPENMNGFVNSFNKYYEVGMQKPFKAYSGYDFSGFQVNTGYRFFNKEKSGFSAYIGYVFSYSENFNNAKIWNNTGYDLETAFSCHDILFEGGYQIKSRAYVHALIGIGIRDIQAKVWKVYQDGSRSMGYEYDINGWYTTNSFSWQLGGSIGFRIWHFFIPIKIWYEVPFFNDNDLSLTDFDVNRYRNSELPNNYEQWLNSAVVKDENNRVPENDFMGLRIQTGVEFSIPFKKNNKL